MKRRRVDGYLSPCNRLLCLRRTVPLNPDYLAVEKIKARYNALRRFKRLNNRAVKTCIKTLRGRSRVSQWEPLWIFEVGQKLDSIDEASVDGPCHRCS